jgi:hypothetical protein
MPLSIRNEDGKSWRIIKRSQYVDVSLAGKGSIGYVYALADGDIIHIKGQPMALSFHTHFDDRYNEEEDQQSTWQWVVAGILGLGSNHISDIWNW